MNDGEIADIVISRLNEILNVDRQAVSHLMKCRVVCNEALTKHGTVQVASKGDTVSVLGLLNGLVGAIKGGRYDGWGYIAAEVDDDGQFMVFKRTDQMP